MLQLRVKKDGWWVFRDAIRDLVEWKTYGNLYAMKPYMPSLGSSGGPWGWGRLPSEYYPSVKFADYIVLSWHTPIAWRESASGSWVIPDVKYSVTTTRHQNKIRTAIGELNG